MARAEGPDFTKATMALIYAAASGSFGSVGLMDSSNQTGVAYGDLTGVCKAAVAAAEIWPPSLLGGWCIREAAGAAHWKLWPSGF